MAVVVVQSGHPKFLSTQWGANWVSWRQSLVILVFGPQLGALEQRISMGGVVAQADYRFPVLPSWLQYLCPRHHRLRILS